MIGINPSLDPNLIRIQSNTNADGGIERAREIFREKVGRDFTPAELNWLTQARGDINRTSAVESASGYADQLGDFSRQIMQDAGSIGLEGIDKGAADKIREQFWSGGTPDANVRYPDLIRNYLGKLYTDQTVNKQKSEIDKIANPGKYLTPEQSAKNASDAQRLAQQFGQEDPDLIDFLSERLAEGESAFEVSQFLQTTPQYLKKQADDENQRVQQESAAARQSLNDELLKGEDEAFKRAVPQIMSSFMRAGRLGSSGIESAVAKERAKLAQERQGFLANAGYQDAIRSQGYRRDDFVGGNAQAFNQYLRQSEPGYQQRFNVQNAGNFTNFQQPYNDLNRFYGVQDRARERQYEIDDYNRQSSDYARYLSSQGGSGLQGALRGAMSGAGAGASFGPWGALIGGGVGAFGGYQAYR